MVGSATQQATGTGRTVAGTVYRGTVGAAAVTIGCLLTRRWRRARSRAEAPSAAAGRRTAQSRLRHGCRKAEKNGGAVLVGKGSAIDGAAVFGRPPGVNRRR